jgi:hypothetical protein
MAQQNRLKANAEKMCETRQAAYLAWELQRRHDIAAAAIPERVWANLFVRGFEPTAAADRAEIYYRSVRPAGLLWRKAKKPQGAVHELRAWRRD